MKGSIFSKSSTRGVETNAKDSRFNSIFSEEQITAGRPYVIAKSLKIFKCRDCGELNVNKPAAAWKGIGLICWKCHDNRISKGMPGRTQWNPKSPDLLQMRKRK